MAENVFNEILETIEGENLPDSFREHLQKKADALFAQQQATEESRYLSKVSRFIVSAWDILKLIATVKPGQVLVVDADGNIYRGNLPEARLAKLQKLHHKVPKYVPSNLDDAAISYTSFVSKSVAEPGNIVRGFSTEWDSAVKKAAKAQQLPVLDMWLRAVRYNNTHGKPVEIRHEIVTNANGEITDTFWADFMDLKFTVNRWGRVLQYEFHGIITKL